MQTQALTEGEIQGMKRWAWISLAMAILVFAMAGQLWIGNTGPVRFIGILALVGGVMVLFRGWALASLSAEASGGNHWWTVQSLIRRNAK